MKMYYIRSLKRKRQFKILYVCESYSCDQGIVNRLGYTLCIMLTVVCSASIVGTNLLAIENIHDDEIIINVRFRTSNDIISYTSTCNISNLIDKNMLNNSNTIDVWP